MGTRPDDARLKPNRVAVARQLAQRTQADLTRQMQQGVLETGDVLPSEHTLAQSYGVSRSTAHNVLVRLQEEHLVYAVTGVGAFVGSPGIRHEAAGVVLVLNGENPEDEMRRLRRGFEAEASRDGLAAVGVAYSRVQALADTDGVADLRGILVNTGHSIPAGSAFPLPASMRAVPMVWYCDEGGASPHADTVTFDQVDGGRQATQHLLEAGHTRIALLALHRPREGYIWSRQRAQGWRDALERAGVACGDDATLMPSRFEPACWDRQVEEGYEVAAECRMNLMKVFLPVPRLLSDPQEDGRISWSEMSPPLEERLEYLFGVARETGVYITLSLAEWGMAHSAWFHDGGEFFGRSDADGSGIDSFAVYRGLWRGLATILKDEPALFSYNLAVELYVPSGNWGGVHEEHSYLFADRWGLPNWRRWLLKRYGNLAGINEAWGTALSSIGDIRQPEIRWLPAKTAYTVDRRIIADYQTFKGQIIYRFLKDQTDAIREVDARHMIACGYHPDQSGIAPVGFAWKTATPVVRELDMFDYQTVHLYTQIPYLIHRPMISSKYEDHLIPFTADAEALEFRRRECLLYARFLECGKPIIVEEFGHLVRDFDESLTGSIELLKSLVGHVSGFQLWTYGSNEKTEDYGPMSTGLTLTDWGREWRRLAEPGGIIADYPKERIPARTRITLDRFAGLAPVEETPAEKILRAWDAYMHPVDFDWPGDPELGGAQGRAASRGS